MIWLTWRQFRVQAATAVAALVVLAAVFVITGRHLADLYDQSGLATCTAHGTCPELRSAFAKQIITGAYAFLYFFGLAAVYLAPALIGMFWGAPLITRELEANTLRLTWTQSVMRSRWLVTKMVLIASAACATTGLLSWLITWWAAPIDRADGLPGGGEALPNRFTPMIFGARDIAPIGYAAFAFVLAVVIGILVRRTVPAMAVTLVAFAAVQILMPAVVRPHLMAPARTITGIDAGQYTIINIHGTDGMSVVNPVNIPGSWVVSTRTIDPSGRPFTGPPTPTCLDENASQQACIDSVSRLRLRQVVTYQPADRFWTFQWYEFGVFTILAAALGGLCVWRVRRLRLA